MNPFADMISKRLSLALEVEGITIKKVQRRRSILTSSEITIWIFLKNDVTSHTTCYW